MSPSVEAVRDIPTAPSSSAPLESIAAVYSKGRRSRIAPQNGDTATPNATIQGSRVNSGKRNGREPPTSTAT